MVQETGPGTRARSWRAQGLAALIAAMAVVMAGCSASPNRETSTHDRTSASAKQAPVPTVRAIAPNSGPTVGGTTVTISGSGFTGTTKVTFGTVAATRFSVVSDTEITAVSPAQTVSMQTIFVTTAGGTSQPVAGADQFTYNASVPTVSGVAPASGPIAGGTTVTITGGGFTGTTKVTFGPVAAISFTVVSDTEITAVSPAQAASTRDIFVTAAGATSTSVPMVDQFTYKK